VLADEGLERGAAAREGCDFASQLIASPLGLRLLVAIGLYLKPELSDFGFEALEAFGDGLKGHLDLTTLEAESLEFLFGDLGFGEKTLGFTVEASEGCGCLSLFVASLGDALDELHRGATVLFSLLFGSDDAADRLLGLRLMALGGLS
jgi:hypothetical protein